MKKEGRQHGMLRIPAAWSPRLGRPCTHADKLSYLPPTAGLLLRVSPMPSIRSKCGPGRSSDCRMHHVGKLKDKACKGMQKHRSRDVVVCNYGLTTWRVTNGGPGFKFSGLSATGILERFAAADYMDCNYDYDYDDMHEES